MRVEPFVVGSYIHVIKRGARGMPITHGRQDRERFLRILYFLNDAYFNEFWDDMTRGQKILRRPETWPPQKPLVEILAYTLMPNHLHLMLKEIRKGGVSLFMKKLGQSMSNHFNQKYDQKGSLFQGAYKSRTIQNDSYLRYAAAYIMVKNVYELYPKGGLRTATAHFDMAWAWAINYRFSSMGTYIGIQDSPIIKKDFLLEVFESPRQFKSFSRDVLLGGKWIDDVEFE